MIGPLGENLVFLLGIPRSGTTLLSAMLDRHSQILCPPEPWIMLALDALGQTHPSHPADAQLLGDASRAFCAGPQRDQALSAFVRTLLAGKLADAQRTVFVDKTPRYFLILPMLSRLFPSAKFIWLIRNPLDVAASYLSSWKVDIARQLTDYPRHRACIDLVVGLQRLMNFCGPSDRIYSIRYEDLAARPAETLTGVLAHLGLPDAPGLCDGDLARSPLASSPFGDQNIRHTDRPHQRSIDSWQRVLNDGQLQLLLDALGPEVFTSLGYGQTLDTLAGRGIRPSGADLASKVEAGLAERLAEVHAGATMQSGRLDEASALAAVAESHPTSVAALLAELSAARAEVPRLGAWADSLRERLAAAEPFVDRAAHLERALAAALEQIHQLQLQANAARNEASELRAAKEQLERPGALFAVELRRLQRNLRRWGGKNANSST